MAGLAPGIVVLALGAGALGGPDALRVLLAVAGQSPVTDIAICVFVIGMITTHVLGVVLLGRFVRKPRAPARARGGGAPRPRAPTTDDCLANMTLIVSVGVSFLVTACLVVVSGAGAGGLMSSLRGALDFPGKSKSPFVVIAAGGFLLLRVGVAPLLRVFPLPLVIGICLPLAPVLAPGGVDELRRFSARSINTIFTSVAALTVVGTVLLAGFSRRYGNGAAAPPDTDMAARFARLRTTQVMSAAAVCCFTLAYFRLLVAVPGGSV